jgi:transposase-like protein
MLGENGVVMTTLDERAHRSAQPRHQGHLLRRLRRLKGLPEVVSNVWPQAVVQTRIIHMLRNIFRLTSRKYWDEIKRDVKPIYTAVNATAARSAFNDLAEKWGQRYPAVVRLWDNAWNEFIAAGCSPSDC